MRYFLLVNIENNYVQLSDILKKNDIYCKYLNMKQFKRKFKQLTRVSIVCVTTSDSIYGQLMNMDGIIHDDTYRIGIENAIGFIEECRQNNIRFFKKGEYKKTHINLSLINIYQYIDDLPKYMQKLYKSGERKSFIIDHVNNYVINENALNDEDNKLISNFKSQLSQLGYFYNLSQCNLHYWLLIYKHFDVLLKNGYSSDSQLNIIIIANVRYTKILSKIGLCEILNHLSDNKDDNIEKIYIYKDIFAIGTYKIMMYYMLLFNYYGDYKFWNNIRKFETNGMWNSIDYYDIPHEYVFNSKIQLTEHILHFSDIIPTIIERIHL
jgi:hypothetical protein